MGLIAWEGLCFTYYFDDQVNVTTDDSSLHIEISQLQPGIQLLVLARFNYFPQLNTTDQGTRGWDFMQLLPISLRNIGQ